MSTEMSCVFKTESSALITKSQEACQKKQEPQNVKEKHIQSLLGGLSLFFKGLLSPIFFFFSFEYQVETSFFPHLVLTIW